MPRIALLAIVLLAAWPSRVAAQDSATPQSLALRPPDTFAPEDSSRASLVWV